MKKKQWKKIVLVLFIAFLLVSTFWYGGNAPGLQGFLTEDNIEQTADTKESAKDAEENVAQTTENGDVVQNTEENATTEAVTTEEETVFQQIVMHIKKKEDSSASSNKSSKKKATTKQVQNTKKAQKNANKTAKKESKKKKSTTSKKKTTKATTTEQKNPDTIQCTIYISCATVLDNMDRVPTAKKKIIPSDGVILKEVQVSVSKDATVFDVLQKATKDNKIHLEYTYTPLYKNYYIEGIYNLYEFDCGNGSGWLYSVNGEFPSEGCSTYDVKDGDIIQWLYTCDFGEDVGKYIK